MLFILLLIGTRVFAQPTTYPTSFTVAQDGSGNFRTIQEAVNAVRDLSQQRVVIHIKKGIYHEKLVIPSWKTMITLKGESRDSTIISYDDYSGKPNAGGKDAFGKDKFTTYTSYTVLVQGNDFRAEDLTIENSAGRVGQAVALHVEGDRAAVVNCRLLGNQDTLYAGTEHSRQYYKDCFIEGTTDFMFGEATVVFDHCTIRSLINSYLTAPATTPRQSFGFVFLDCKLTADTAARKVFLGRPWRPYGKSVFIRTEMGAHIAPAGWDNWRNPENEKTAYFAEYESRGPGAGSAGRVSWSKQLTAKEANQYTISNILGDWASQQVMGDGIQMDSVTILQRMKTENIPALGVAYIEEGRVKEIKVYGELKQGVPAPFNTVFNVASITKTITTLVTLRLVNAGNWSLDEPVCHYWTDPDVRDDPRSKKLTTRHILTHQTGFPNWRWMTSSKKLAFEFEPGARFQYSGEGMEYLRRALESKFHRSLEQLADSLIFGPLHMKDSHLIWKDSMLSHFAFPHNAKGEELEINKNTDPSAADLLKTTVADYSTFMIWVMNGAGLSKALYREMTSPLSKIKDNKYMGLGWAVYPELPGGQYGLSHSGEDPGVKTIAIILPESKRGLLIFTNSDNGPQLYTDLVKGYLKEQGNAIFIIETKN